MTIETPAPKERLRRTKSQDSVDRIAVRTALAPVRELLGPLQYRAAMLAAQAARPGGDTGPLALKIADLQADLVKVKSVLDGIIAGLPPERRGHGQIVDLDRALSQIHGSIQLPRR